MGYVLVVIKSGSFFGCVSPGNVIEPHRHICASFWMQIIEGDCEQWQSSCQSPRFFPIPRMLISFWFPTIKHNHKIWPHHASKGIAICNHLSVFAFLFLTRNHNSGAHRRRGHNCVKYMHWNGKIYITIFSFVSGSRFFQSIGKGFYALYKIKFVCWS